MDYFIIKGHFHVVGYSPDGDSLMFEANNPKHWEKLQSQYQDLFNQKLEQGNGSVQLRLQGVDALETHYSPSSVPTPKGMSGKSWSGAVKPKPAGLKQPAHYADAATTKLLSLLGAENVQWKSRWGHSWIDQIDVKEGRKMVTYTDKNKDKLPGYVIVNDIERKGRPISWVFGGKTSYSDGKRLTTGQVARKIKQTINYRLLANGLVYPYFFMTLSSKLRTRLIYGVKNAERQKMNIWSVDKTQKGVKINAFSELVNETLVYPYLFRRMAKHQFLRQTEGYWEAVANKKDYIADAEAVFLDTFFRDTNPYVFLIEERDFVRLDSIVQISGNKIKLTTSPRNIVFLS